MSIPTNACPPWLRSMFPRAAAAYGSRLLLRVEVLRVVGEVEADGQLEVELDGGALELALQRVVHRDVDLGAVEGAVPLVDLHHGHHPVSTQLIPRPASKPATPQQPPFLEE